MTVDTESLRTAFGRERVKRASKLTLGAASLVVVVALASLLPGAGLVVPATGVSVWALVTALATAAVVGLLAYLAPALATLTRVAVDGPREVVEGAASVVYWLVVLAGVLVAHAGFGLVAAGLLGGVAWLYDLAFLLAGLVPLVVVTARLYDALDPAADHLAGRVADGDRSENASGDRDEQGDDGVTS